MQTLPFLPLPFPNSTVESSAVVSRVSVPFAELPARALTSPSHFTQLYHVFFLYINELNIGTSKYRYETFVYV